MPTHFDRATAVTPLAGGHFSLEVSEDFWVQSGPNGGYLSAIALRAALALETDAARVARSLHVRFLAAPKAGPAELWATVVRRGRSMTTIALRMAQAGTDFLHASACLSEPFSSVAFADKAPPSPRPLADSVAVPKQIPLNHRFEMWRALGGEPRASERALSGGYIRFADARPYDALALACLWDTWPPAVFARKIEQRYRGATPTVEVSIYFRRSLPLPALRADDYVLLKVESTTAHDGIAEEDAEIWSLDGVLLAQSRQLLLLF